MKKVLIICNGNPPAQELFKQYRANADYLICADGGGNTAIKFGNMPDVVIGDLDSFDTSDNYPFDIIHNPDQETNDLEKALHLAKKKGGTHIDVLGATGYRLDHTLKNLSVLKQFHRAFEKLQFADDFGKTLLISSPFERSFPVGTALSLFPLSGKVTNIVTQGLRYPLNNESLENGVRDGSSNEVSSNPVRITFDTGDLILFIAR